MLDPMKGRLVGKNVLITGGAGRIGSATAKSALNEGAQVVLADISAERLEDVVSSLPASTRSRVHSITADVTSEAGITKLIDHAAYEVGPITSAVHSAYPTSVGWGSAFEELKSSYLNEDLACQLGGAILFSQKILGYFQAHNIPGNLIHISSIQGVCAPKFEHYRGTSMTSPIEYTAIKAGVIAATRWLAKYYSGKNMRINCISPGGILDGQPDEFLQRYRDSCSNFGMLKADQIASAVVFLLMPEAEAINGQNLIVDDGWSL